MVGWLAAFPLDPMAGGGEGNSRPAGRPTVPIVIDWLAGPKDK